jgi:hypothetical protein
MAQSKNFSRVVVNQRHKKQNPRNTGWDLQRVIRDLWLSKVKQDPKLFDAEIGVRYDRQR